MIFINDLATRRSALGGGHDLAKGPDIELYIFLNHTITTKVFHIQRKAVRLAKRPQLKIQNKFNKEFKLAW